MSHDQIDSTPFLENLNKRIDAEFQRLQIISHRISQCSKRIEAVSKRNNISTTVYSLSKFPGTAIDTPENMKDYLLNPTSTLFSKLPQPIPEKPPVINLIGKRVSDKMVVPLTTLKRDVQLPGSVLCESFRNTCSALDKIQHSLKDQDTQGLGRLPTNLESVSSLLLFNSSENPYKTYFSFDNLAGLNTFTQETRDHTTNTEELAAAPVTLSGMFGSDGPNPLEEFVFSPEIGVVPDLGLPVNLPNLNLVADDIKWDANEDIIDIAPSAVKSAVFDTDFDDEVPSNVHPSSSPAIPPNPMPHPHDFQSSDNTGPPLPPETSFNGPPLPDIPSNTASDNTPPPPPIPDLPDFSAGRSPSTNKKSNVRQPLDLLADIRGFGGDKTKLKPKSNRPANFGSHTTSKPASLMGALQASLLLRRQGISRDHEDPIDGSDDGSDPEDPWNSSGDDMEFLN